MGGAARRDQHGDRGLDPASASTATPSSAIGGQPRWPTLGHAYVAPHASAWSASAAAFEDRDHLRDLGVARAADRCPARTPHPWLECAAHRSGGGALGLHRTRARTPTPRGASSCASDVARGRLAGAVAAPEAALHVIGDLEREAQVVPEALVGGDDVRVVGRQQGAGLNRAPDAGRPSSCRSSPCTSSTVISVQRSKLMSRYWPSQRARQVSS